MVEKDDFTYSFTPPLATESFTHEDLEQDEAPSTHAADEAHHGRKKAGLTSITKSQHSNSSKQQAPEHASAKVGLHCREDQVELDHLQRNSDGPINITIQDGGTVDNDPELVHVEVMNSSNQCNQSADVHGCLPMKAYSHRFHQEEHGCSHH